MAEKEFQVGKGRTFLMLDPKEVGSSINIFRLVDGQIQTEGGSWKTEPMSSVNEAKNFLETQKYRRFISNNRKVEMISEQKSI